MVGTRGATPCCIADLCPGAGLYSDRTGGRVSRVARARGRGHQGQHPCKRHHGALWGLCAAEAHSKAVIPTEAPDSTLGHTSSEVQSSEPEACHSFWDSLLLCIALTVWQTQGAQPPCHPAWQVWQSDFQHYQVQQVPSQASSSNGWADTALRNSCLAIYFAWRFLSWVWAHALPGTFPPSSSSCSSRHQRSHTWFHS